MVNLHNHTPKPELPGQKSGEIPEILRKPELFPETGTGNFSGFFSDISKGLGTNYNRAKFGYICIRTSKVMVIYVLPQI